MADPGDGDGASVPDVRSEIESIQKSVADLTMLVNSVVNSQGESV